MNDTKPLVSVILPIYNMGEFASRAIESILNQTLTSLELILVDDGSTDTTPMMIQHYAEQNDRIVVLTNRLNQGLIASLNRALTIARGIYIARQDGDDYSVPNRLEAQVSFLQAHPDIGVVAGQVCAMNSDGMAISEPGPKPIDMSILKFRQLFGITVAGPTIVARRDLIEQVGGYDPTMIHAEDYHLYWKLSQITKLALLPQPVMYLYRHAGSVTNQHWDIMWQTWQRVSSGAMSELLGWPIPSDWAKPLIQMIVSFKIIEDPALLERSIALLLDLFQTYMLKTDLSAATYLEFQHERLAYAQRYGERVLQERGRSLEGLQHTCTQINIVYDTYLATDHFTPDARAALEGERDYFLARLTLERFLRFPTTALGQWRQAYSLFFEPRIIKDVLKDIALWQIRKRRRKVFYCF